MGVTQVKRLKGQAALIVSIYDTAETEKEKTLIQYTALHGSCDQVNARLDDILAVIQGITEMRGNKWQGDFFDGLPSDADPNPEQP